MVTSRTQIDGKRKVKHMIEITGTSNSQAGGKKRA